MRRLTIVENSIDKEFIGFVDLNYSRPPQYYRNDFRKYIEARKVVKGMWPTVDKRGQAQIK